MEVSRDFEARWDGSGGVATAPAGLARWWMHGLLWSNGLGTVARSGGGLSSTEAETAARVALLSGAPMTVSEALPAILDQRAAALSPLFPAPTIAAVPLDLYDRAQPAVYFAAGDRVLLGAVNWSDAPASFRVNPRRILGAIPADEMLDSATGDSQPIPRGALAVDLAPRASRLFEFRRTPQPRRHGG